MIRSRFHLAFNVKDIESTRKFYIDILGCQAGQSTDEWLDFNFFGHQVSAHVGVIAATTQGQVDDLTVPTPHFGCLLTEQDFSALIASIDENNLPYMYAPQIRYAGKKYEQKNFFIKDFSGNVLEFKCYKHDDAVFM